METIHIFDEYLISPLYLNDEDRHLKRMKLEPLIFDILKSKYGKILQEKYKLYEPPPIGKEKGLIIIVERRIHENLQFILHNAATAAPNWRIIIICSDINKRYCEIISENKAIVIDVFKGSPGRDKARSEYNKLLKDPEFYRHLPSENLLFLQTDSYLRKSIPESFMNYDYIGAPFTWDKDNMGGGLTFRKRGAMIDICTNFHENIDSEDLFISKGIDKFNYKKPSYFEAIPYFSESTVFEEPVGVHQWWTFFYPGIDNPEVFFKKLLMLQYLDCP
jgi:hypothetical protein